MRCPRTSIRSESWVLRSNRLSWGVDFTCNVFDNNALNYAYRLEGMDDGWHRLGTQHRIDFTGLGFGRYRLTVCTLAPDGTPSDNSRSLAIFIRPPWWRSLAAGSLTWCWLCRSQAICSGC